MAVAVFGATGFMGYNFVCQFLREISSERLFVYTGSPDKLVNLSRHRLEIIPVNWAEIDGLELPEAVDTVVNFSHPFRMREGMSPESQIDAFGRCIRRNASRRALRLIQLSSMVVYEPFQSGRMFDEGDELPPIKPDDYSRQKVYLERATHSWGVPVANLRPTIVYGPFGVDFTDLFLNGFASGNLEYHSLEGRIQPIFVGDVSEIVLDLLKEFRPGPLNLGGPEIMSWKSYLEHYQRVVGAGALLHRASVRLDNFARKQSVTGLLSNIVRRIFRDPDFRDLIHPLVQKMPSRLRGFAKRTIDEPPSIQVSCGAGLTQSAVPSLYNTNPALLKRLQGKLAADFFAQDRLVSIEQLRRQHAGRCTTSVSSVSPLLARYFQFRFCDGF